MERKSIVTILSVVMLTFATNACVYHNEEEIQPQDDCSNVLTYKDDIVAIISSNCAVSGCHVSGGQNPDLSTYDKISSNLVKVRLRIKNGTMPKVGSGYSLTQQERNEIICWIDQGGIHE